MPWEWVDQTPLLDGAAYDPVADSGTALPSLPDVGVPWNQGVAVDGTVVAWAIDAAGTLHPATLAP